MKKNIRFITVLLGCLLTMSTMSCKDDNNNSNINYTDLPQKVRNTLEKHFGEAEVVGVKKSDNGYDVQLKGGYEVDFDAAGNWTSIDAYNDAALPQIALAMIPRGIIDYVNNEYPTRGISEVSKESYGYKVELTSNPDVELLFGFDGKFIGLENDNDHNEIVDYTALPEAVKTFFAAHFSQADVARVEKDDNEYEITLKNKLQIKLDFLGNWLSVDANNNTIPASVIALLPEKARTYISANYATKQYEEIEKEDTVYDIELRYGINLLFDMDGNLLNENNNNTSNNDDEQKVDFASLPQISKDFVTKHFAAVAVRYVSKDKDSYDVTLADNTEIEFNLDGALQSIEVKVSTGVPTAVMLQAISTYVTTNYVGKVVMEYEVLGAKYGGGYKVELSGYPQYELYFNSDGNFLRVIID